MKHAELHRLSELRIALEGLASRHAALHFREHPTDLDSFREILRDLNEATRKRDYARFRECDYALHSGIVARAEVPVLVESWQRVWDAQADFHEETFEECFPDARFLAEEHTHLVETLALGDPAAAEDAARSHLEAVWFRLADGHHDHTGEAPADALQRTVAHLAFSYSRPLRLQEVASQIAYTSPGHLSRLFREHYGVSFQRYLQNLRLDKAAELLRATRLPVASVARRVGYRDVSRFGQHFKRRFDVTPTAWRSEQGKIPPRF